MVETATLIDVLTLTTRQANADDTSKMSQFIPKCQKFHDHIRNHHEKYIQTVQNMP